jgi:hypothetical protein
MTALVWRQYRLQAALAAFVLAVFAAVMLITGFREETQWHSLLAICTASGTCGNLNVGSTSLGSVLGHDFAILSLMTPALFGMLVGAPLVAHEFEARTNDFAWAQSITRTRWLFVKVGWLLLAAALWGGVISALVTWWSGPRNAAFDNAFQTNYFDMQGLVPVGYAVFATALGIAAGAVLRRTLPAIAIVLGGFIGLRLWISQDLRAHFMTPVTAYYSMTGSFNAPDSLSVGGGLVSKSGQLVTAPSPSMPAACKAFITSNNLSNAQYNAGASCLQHEGFRQFATYQPASRYWAFQGIEAGIYLAVAAVLIALTFYVVHRKDA